MKHTINKTITYFRSELLICTALFLQGPRCSFIAEMCSMMQGRIHILQKGELFHKTYCNHFLNGIMLHNHINLEIQYIILWCLPKVSLRPLCNHCTLLQTPLDPLLGWSAVLFHCMASVKLL